MKKSGLTMASMVLYVALFFAFSAFAIAISTNFNYKTLTEKGSMWVNEQYDKLQYNLLNSAKQSRDVSKISGKIVFTNNDEYAYDSSKKAVLKNGGIVAMDVESFEIVTNPQNSSLGVDFPNDLDKNVGSVALKVSFNKYGSKKESKIFVTAGVDENEKS